MKVGNTLYNATDFLLLVGNREKNVSSHTIENYLRIISSARGSFYGDIKIFALQIGFSESI